MSGAWLLPMMSEGILRACVWGGLFTLLIWTACRALPRLPAAVRCWLWWLACLKMTADLFVAGIVPLPIATPAVPLPVVALMPIPAPSPAPSARKPAPSDEKEEPIAPTPPRMMSAPAPTRRAFPISFPVLLALLYGASAFTLLAASVRRWRKVRQLIRHALPVNDSAITETAQTIANAYRISPPRIVTLASAPSPFVVGAFRPTIVLPARFAETVTPDNLRLALTHEMAHLRRGDLWLGALPLLARTLLFFFPLAYLACREYEQAREEACDADALTLCHGRSAQYGLLLLSMADGVPATLGMAAPGFSGLRRRLLTLQREARPLGRPARAAAFALILPFTLGVVPWRLSASAELSALPNAALARPVAPTRYELVDIGTLGGLYSDANAISDAGHIVGAANIDPSQERGHAFIHTGIPANNPLRDLSADSDYRRSIAFAVNREGVVAAAAYQREARPQAFIWDGKRRYLGSLPNFRYSKAVGINAARIVAANAVSGKETFGAVPTRAFVYQAGAKIDVGTLGGPYSHASAINDAGIVVGKADLPRTEGEIGETHAFIWQANHGMRDLGTLPGGANSRAYAVNARGDVVGFSETGDGETRAFLFPVGGNMQDLGRPSDARGSVAFGVNDNGQMVGATTVSDGKSHALLWQRTPNGVARPIDLNGQIASNSGWVLETARGINNRGWIVGQGRINGRQRAFLLRPEALP